MREELRRIRQRMVEGAGKGLVDCAEDLLGASQLDAPIETGRLRASGTIVSPSGRRGEPDIDLARGRATIIVAFTVVYAARQHEEVTWKHPRGGKAKYLESNLVEQSGRYDRLIQARVAEALKA